jgi:hypothetical protein
MGPIRSFVPFTVLALVAVLLVGANAWPVQPTNKRIVLRDFTDHAWWATPHGFLMEPCYEFTRQSDHQWLLRCGNWLFTITDNTGDFGPADEKTRIAWQKALDRRGSQ